MDAMRIMLDVAIVLLAIWMILLASFIQQINWFWTCMKIGTVVIGIGVAVAAWLDLAKHVFGSL